MFAGGELEGGRMQIWNKCLHLKYKNDGIHILWHFNPFARKPGALKHMPCRVHNLSGYYNCGNVVQRLALSPHRKKLWVRSSGLCMFSMCLCGFSLNVWMFFALSVKSCNKVVTCPGCNLAFPKRLLWPKSFFPIVIILNWVRCAFFLQNKMDHSKFGLRANLSATSAPRTAPCIYY